MKKQPLTFALYFGNRGFFPETLVAGARRELAAQVEALGYTALLLEESATRFGAVETPEEGRVYARFLEQNKGKYDGVILCLPNFGDETGAVTALLDCGVPILIQAYPDELDKMGFKERRDAFCGKFSIMDVFYQYGLSYTVFPPHTAHPASGTFKTQLEQFAGVCRVVGKMKRMTVGAIGARTTAFKTVRFDELTLQRYGITTETLDLSDVFLRVKSFDTSREEFKARSQFLPQYANCSNVPAPAQDTMAKLSVVLDDIIAEYRMDAISFRCWLEMEKELKIAPCLLMSELNNRGIPAACEVDMCNAITMYALRLAAEKPATCLDWNNNYGDAQDKCILFHCGAIAQTYMIGKGEIVDHKMFAKAYGEGCAWGTNVGRIKDFPMTFASSKTENGKLINYFGTGEFTKDVIEEGFFGCAGVVKIDDLQKKLIAIGRNGYRHHVSVTQGTFDVAVREAFQTYLKYEIEEI